LYIGYNIIFVVRDETASSSFIGIIQRDPRKLISTTPEKRVGGGAGDGFPDTETGCTYICLLIFRLVINQCGYSLCLHARFTFSTYNVKIRIQQQQQQVRLRSETCTFNRISSRVFREYLQVFTDSLSLNFPPIHKLVRMIHYVPLQSYNF